MIFVLQNVIIDERHLAGGPDKEPETRVKADVK